MAEEEKTKVESQDADGAGAPKAPSAIKTYGIYAGIALAVIVGAYFVTLKVVKPMFSHKTTAAQTTDSKDKKEATDKKASEEKKDAKEEPKAEGGHGEGEAGKEKSETPEKGTESALGGNDNIYMIRDIIVNPAGTGGTRFLSTTVGFQIQNSKTSTILSEQDAVVRDALITILSSQTIPELGDFRQREKLRQLIRQRVQRLLGTDDIAGVYFTEFVLQ
jgi:flagellar basal body-associated protein FliL